MAKFLDLNGVSAIWKKVKDFVEAKSKEVADELKGVVKEQVTDKLGQPRGIAGLDENGKLFANMIPTNQFKTVNGKSVVGQGDITIDLSLYKVVESLPTADIDQNKIYLVLTSAGVEKNEYSEYIYTGSKWELMGQYSASVDLTPYVKFTDVASASKAGAMSSAHFTKVEGIADGATADEALTVAEVEAVLV